MADFRNSPLTSYRDVVATLRDRQIEARITELKREDEMTMALRDLLAAGADINTLSEASGIPVDQIRKQTERELHFGEDLASLSGTR